MRFIVCRRLLQYLQDLVLYFLRHLNAACLKAMRPCTNLFALHGVEYLSELLDVGLGVLLLFCSLETVKLLVVKIEVAVVIPFCAVGVLSATYAVLAVMAVMIFCRRPVAVNSVYHKKTGYDKYEYRRKNYGIVHVMFLFVLFFCCGNGLCLL